MCCKIASHYTPHRGKARRLGPIEGGCGTANEQATIKLSALNETDHRRQTDQWTSSCRISKSVMSTLKPIHSSHAAAPRARHSKTESVRESAKYGQPSPMSVSCSWSWACSSPALSSRRSCPSTFESAAGPGFSSQFLNVGVCDSNGNFQADLHGLKFWSS
jgi:hypothetical protein